MPKKHKKVGRFTRHQLDKHRALLASAPDTIEKRQNNIHHRNQLLASTQAYNLGLEKTRIQSHLTSRPTRCSGPLRKSTWARLPAESINWHEPACPENA